MLTGSEAVLESSLIAAIQAGITANCLVAPIAPNCINGLAEGIANAIIPHLIGNIQVDSGAACGVGSHPTGGAAVGTVTGVTTIS